MMRLMEEYDVLVTATDTKVRLLATVRVPYIDMR